MVCAAGCAAEIEEPAVINLLAAWFSIGPACEGSVLVVVLPDFSFRLLNETVCVSIAVPAVGGRPCAISVVWLTAVDSSRRCGLALGVS